ncbi:MULTISPECIES: hypothetical protein [Natrialbaceae]|uniref:hypothetical protein n=1 Tax=Natrialbaceae TaxID=1644061 RepID=UPI00207D5AC3|nr:hypothetical protein [Natronococcus sp. CG52]
MSDTSDRTDAPIHAPSERSELRTSRLADGNWIVASIPDAKTAAEREDRTHERDPKGDS